MTSSHPVGDLWQTIEKALAELTPATLRTLAPPATRDEITTLESSVGRVLPSDLVASLLRHNGQHSTECDFTGAGILFSTKGIADSWQMVSELDDEYSATGESLIEGSWW